MEPFSHRPYKQHLKNSWTLWYRNIKQVNLPDGLMPVGSFDTLEDFWCLAHHVKPIDMLVSKCDYMLFRTGIRPVWEDKDKKETGRWILELKKSTEPLYLHKFWIEMQLFLILEKIHPQTPTIKGGVISVNYDDGDSFRLWTCNTKELHQPEIINIGMNIKALMNCSPSQILSYEVHEENDTKQLERKIKYYV